MCWTTVLFLLQLWAAWMESSRASTTPWSPWLMPSRSSWSLTTSSLTNPSPPCCWLLVWPVTGPMPEAFGESNQLSIMPPHFKSWLVILTSEWISVSKNHLSAWHAHFIKTSTNYWWNLQKVQTVKNISWKTYPKTLSISDRRPDILAGLNEASNCNCFNYRHNENKTFLVWVNEEDHLRVISMQKGGNMKEVFKRFCVGLQRVWRTCKDKYIHSDVTHSVWECACSALIDWGNFQEAQPWIYVEWASWFRSDLPLQPGNRPARWSPRQAAQAQHTCQVWGDPEQTAPAEAWHRYTNTVQHTVQI